MPVKPDLILATNPTRISFNLGECTGGGAADGMEVIVLVIDEWHDEEEGVTYPEKKVVFSRHTCRQAIIAMATYLARTDEDRAEGSELTDGDDS